MEKTIEKAEDDSDTGLNLEEIKKIPKGLYDFLCSGSNFIPKDDYSYLVKRYGLAEGKLLACKKLHTCVCFVGHGEYNKCANRFVLWPGIPREDKVINLKIICGDSSFSNEEGIYWRQGIYVDFRPDMKLLNSFQASVYSAIFNYLKECLDK